jgi:hypothetical protein
MMAQMAYYVNICHHPIFAHPCTAESHAVRAAATSRHHSIQSSAGYYAARLWPSGCICIIPAHAKPHPVSVTWLCHKSGSKAVSLRSFRQKLKAALDQIAAVGAIQSWAIVDDLVHVVRQPTPSQQRFIARQG